MRRCPTATPIYWVMAYFCVKLNLLDFNISFENSQDITSCCKPPKIDMGKAPLTCEQKLTAMRQKWNATENHAFLSHVVCRMLLLAKINK